jgi:hypothetical protein
MLIEFTRNWRQFQPGQRTDFFTEGAADILFRKNVARPVVAEVAPVATATDAAPLPAPAPAPAAPSRITARSAKK